MREGVEDWQLGTGDMPPAAFREYAHLLADWMADYVETLDSRPVLSQVNPGEISARLPDEAPEWPEPVNQILADFDEIVMPGVTHWNHPAFFAYFAITGSASGILGEMLAAALNVNAMLWRTSPAATELETTVLRWLRSLVGLPEVFEGVIYDTASISSLVAIAAAREAAGHDIRQRGMAGRTDLPALRLYCSEHAHSSIEKDAITLGIGQDNVRKIACDAEFRLVVRALRAAIEEDVRAGMKPFCVVATVGTTSATSVDPVGDIAEVCSDAGMWLHVDAAYAGMAAILPEMRSVMEGVERADSVVVNPHKWLFTPLDCSAFYSRRLDTVRQAFSLVPPAYLQTAEGDRVRDYMNYGPQLGRRFRALKLWFVLRSFGQEGIRTRLREHIRLARLFARWVDESPEWEVMAPTPFSTVCFRAHPGGVEGDELDRLNVRIEEAVNAIGKAFLSHTALQGRVVLRLAIGNLHTEERHVSMAWEELNHALRSVTPTPAPEPDATRR